MIDEKLCGLVDLLPAVGQRHTLGVELRLREVRDDLEEWVSPKFMEKGAVSVVDDVHSSVHNR